MARREYSGNAPATTLTSGINNAVTAIPVVSIAGFPTGSGGNFYIVIDRGLAGEEKILCSLSNGTTITAAGRGGIYGDDTSAAAHNAGATVEHVFTATDADEANAHVNDAASHMTNALHDVEARHTFGAALGTAGTPAAVAVAAAVGTGANPAREDHVHNEKTRVGCTLTFPSEAFSDAVLDTATFTVEVADTDGFIAVPATTITIPAGLGGIYTCTYTITSSVVTTGRSYVRLDLSGEATQLYQGAISVGDISGMISVTTPMAVGATVLARAYIDAASGGTYSGRLDLYRIGA